MKQSLAVAVCVSLFLVLAAAAHGDELKVTYSFTITIPQIGTGTFRSVQGLGSETEVIEFRDGTTGVTRKIPGALKYSDIVLKRVVSTDKTFAQWRALVEAGTGTAARKNGTIALFDQSGKEIARWNFVEGWPSKISIDSDEDTGEVIEKLVLTVESVSRQ